MGNPQGTPAPRLGVNPALTPPGRALLQLRPLPSPSTRYDPEETWWNKAAPLCRPRAGLGMAALGSPLCQGVSLCPGASWAPAGGKPVMAQNAASGAGGAVVSPGVPTGHIGGAVGPGWTGEGLGRVSSPWAPGWEMGGWACPWWEGRSSRTTPRPSTGPASQLQD